MRLNVYAFFNATGCTGLPANAGTGKVAKLLQSLRAQPYSTDKSPKDGGIAVRQGGSFVLFSIRIKNYVLLLGNNSQHCEMQTKK